ncbi:MAG: YihY/virulence factor BrkB family protein [Gemmatimonadota bacterium]
MTPRATSMISLAVEATVRWFRHGAPALSAAMAFYMVISLAPLLLIAMGIAAPILGAAEVRTQLVADIARLTDPETAAVVDELLRGVWLGHSGLLASILAGAAFLLTSTMAFEHLRDVLNRVWESPTKPGLPLFDLVRGRLLSFALVLATGVVLLIALAVRTYVFAYGAFLAGPTGPGIAIFHALEALAFLVGFSAVFAVLFRVLPDPDPAWRDVLPGALLTAILFLAGEFAIGAYLSRFAIASAYGAVGSLVVLLYWIYYSSMVILWGAEFTCVSSSHRRPDELPDLESGRADGGTPSPSSTGGPRDASAPPW